MKRQARSLHHSRGTRLGSLATSLAVCLTVTGCVASGASPTGSPASIASPSASQTAPSTPSPAPSLSPSLGPSTASPDERAELVWRSAGAAFPQSPIAPDGGSVEVGVFGWSRGYVGFRAAYTNFADLEKDTVTIVSTASNDGIHWTPGRPVDTAGLKWVVSISDVKVGPSGLLALGHYPRATCGGPGTVDVMWSSTDGLTWSRVQPPADFASARVFTVEGGSSGYVATGTLSDGTTQAVWISSDGRSWHRAALPQPTVGDARIDGATSFAAGFVLAGAMLGDEGCGGPNSVTPSLWHSIDGTAWSRVQLIGAPAAPDATMRVARISDKALMAVATEYGGAPSYTATEHFWVTSDGLAWTPVSSPSPLLDDNVITDGRRGLVLDHPADGGPPALAWVDDHLTVTSIAQSGDGPNAPPWSNLTWTVAPGPAGVVALASDGSNLWLGETTPASS